ncbi:hypothetical protein WJX77_007539 [Trebouxia sp. C0004]
MAVDRSPFAAPAQNSERSVTDGVNSGEALHPSRAASPGSLPQTLSHPTSGPAFRSPASWFNRTTSSATGSNPKHSLLAMVPSQPLSRPTQSAPPSPASHLQPPTIPALDDLKHTEEFSTLPAAPVCSTAPASPVLAAAQPAGQNQNTESDSKVDAGKQDPEGAELAASKQAKRDKRLRKTEANMRWQLMRKLAEISADVELLNHEVTRIRYEQSTAVLAEEQRDLSEQEEQQVEVLHQKRSADLVLRQCATCLKSVTAHKWAFPFAKPVDINLFKDYPNIIVNPMDFATIKANVEGGVYKEPQQFYDGMKLVFNNARRYNPPGSDVNLMASGVEEKFEERWQALLAPKLAEEQTHIRTDAAAVRKQRLDRAQARLAGELEQHRMRLLSVFDNLHSRIMDAKTLAAAACKPVSQQDKEALLPALEALSPDQFEGAMSLVHARYPGLPTGPGEEMQFDITCLDSLALRQLMDLTQACARAAKMAEGGEVQVTWPANPVGVGSRGHKPASNKRARRSPTPPTLLSAHPTASAPPSFTAAPQSVPLPSQHSQGQAPLPTHTSAASQLHISSMPAHQPPAMHTGTAPFASMAPQQASAAVVSQPPQAAAPHTGNVVAIGGAHPSGVHQLAAGIQTVRQPQVESVRPEHVTHPAGPVPADGVAQQSSQVGIAPVSHEPTKMAPLPSAGAGSSASAQQAPSAQASHAANAFLSRQGAAANAADDQAMTKPIAGARGFPSEAMNIDSHGLTDPEAAARAAESQPQHTSNPMPDNAQQQLVSQALPSQPSHHTTSLSQPAVSLVKSPLRSTDAEAQLQQLVPQPAETPAAAQSQAQPEAQQEGQHVMNADSSQQNVHNLSCEAHETWILGQPGIADPKQASDKLPHVDAPGSVSPSADKQQQRQQQEQQSKSETDALAEYEPGVERQSQGDTLQEQVQHKVAAAAAVQEGQLAQATEGTQGSTADSDADDNQDDNAEGRMIQEEQEASPAPAEARRSVQPCRRRQAAQRRSSPRPLASRAAGRSSGRKAAGRGGTGRGRAATPAARAAAVQKPRRLTSRSTAGKRRRSPS